MSRKQTPFSMYSLQGAKRRCRKCGHAKPIKGGTSSGRGKGFVCGDCKVVKT